MFEIRKELLTNEQHAYATGHAVPPMTLIVGRKNPEMKIWNQNQKLQRRLETAAMLLEMPATWRLIRKILRDQSAHEQSRSGR